MKWIYCRNVLKMAMALALLTLSSLSLKGQPVNPNSSREARELLDFITQLSGKQILAGQHSYCNDLKRPMDSVLAITGKQPALWGSDLMGYDHGSHDTRQEVIDQAIDYHKNGKIITLMYHMVKPWDHDSKSYALSVKGRVTDEQWEKVIDSSSVEHAQWLEKIDHIAKYLKQLREMDIPVLWRPFHEMNGNWFWYGDRKGEDGIQKLWKLMYDRYVNHHHLDNLIWVWNPNAPREDAFAYEHYYPGDGYVDILAADIYANDYKQSHHDELVALGNGKPIAIGECGELPTRKILKEQPQWVWFMCWVGHVWEKENRRTVKRLYRSKKVVTSDEL